MTLLQRSLRTALDLIWPRTCLVCDVGEVADSAACCICGECEQALVTDPFQTCPRCTSNVGPHTDVTHGCPACHKTKFHFDSAIRLGLYDGLLRESILKCKFDGGEALAENLGTLWAEKQREQLMRSQPQLVIPVPLHYRRRWVRGFNQSEAVARGMSRALQLPLSRWALRRVRATPPQTTMTPAERRTNVVGAFATTRFAKVQGLRVLLVDDVLTTGATLDAAAQVLLAAGAAQVHVAVLAHR